MTQRLLRTLTTLLIAVGAVAAAACRPDPAASPPNTAAAADTAAPPDSAASARAPETSPPSPQVADGTFDASSAERYTATCAALLRELEPTFAVNVSEPLVLDLVAANRRLQLSVQRVWSYCEGNPHDCERATREYLQASVDQIATQFGAPQLAQLRAAIRETDYVESLRQTEPDVLAEPLVADLWVVYVRDTPAAALMLSSERLSALKVDADDAKRIGRHNVLEALGALEPQLQTLPEQGIGYIQTGNYYVSSYLLDLAGWESAAAQMKGRLLVAAPARDLIVYADSTSPNLDLVLEPLLENMMRRSQIPLSKTILAWTASGWVEWDGKP